MASLLSVWIALGALLTSLLVVFTNLAGKETVLTLLPYTMALSATFAAATLWAHRRKPATEKGIAGQRLQSLAAIALNALTFAILLFWLHGLLKGLAGLALEGVFLALIYWLYTRILVPDK